MSRESGCRGHAATEQAHDYFYRSTGWTNRPNGWLQQMPLFLSTSSARLDCALLGFGLYLLQMSTTSAWFGLFWQASERPMTSIVCDKMQIGDIPAAEL